MIDVGSVKPPLVLPLDFSFKDIASVDDLESQEPNPRPGAKQSQSEQQQRVVTAIRLPNNRITSIDHFSSVAAKLFSNPDIIGWIDLSFNSLKTIDKDLLNFRNLSTLYLHANDISSLSETEKLSQLTRLRTLTLHGNPVENVKGYRHIVVGKLPTLKHLDFCAITKQDRFIARIGDRRGKSSVRKRRSREEDEDA